MDDTEQTFQSRTGAVDFGGDYENLMAAYLALTFTLNNEIADFHMSTNNNDMENFDDVVLEIEFRNSEKHLFGIQLKHTKRIIAQQKLINNNPDFDLNKYFEGFKKIKRKWEKSSCQYCPFENYHFILFTNSVLQNFEEISEKRLLKRNGEETDTTIIKSDSPFGKQLFSLCDSENEFIYQFKTEQRNSIKEDFFKNFTFYTKQKNSKELLTVIEQILNKFNNYDIILHFINYFDYWRRGDYGNFKLTKEDVILKLSELLLVDYIPEPNLTTLEAYNNENETRFSNLAATFKIILIEDDFDAIMCKIWGILLHSIPKITDEWTKPITGFYIKLFQKALTLPISAYSENFNQLSLQKIYLIYWHIGLLPLVIKFKDNPNDNKNIFFALKLCENLKQNFILMGKHISQHFTGRKVLKNLTDLDFPSNFFNNTLISLQGRPKVLLKDLIETNKLLLNIFSINEMILMLNNKFVLGNDLTELCPKYLIKRRIPKILIDIKSIIETEDLFIINNHSNVENLELLLQCTVLDLQNYIRLMKTAKNENFILKKIPLCLVDKFDENNLKFVLICDDISYEQMDELYSKTGKNCHYVHLCDGDSLEWIQTRGTINNLFQFQQNDNEKFVNDSEALDYFTNPVNILCADPGMGKSVMMQILKFSSPSNHWAISINLREHLDFFDKTHESDEVIQYFLNIESKINKLGGEAAKIFASNKKLIFLWDGFDEMPSSCMDFVIFAIKKLTEIGYRQWISARNNFKEFLEKTFNVFAVTLSKLTVQNQYDYIYSHLKDVYQDEDTVQEFVRKIDDNISTALNCRYFDYSGIPLHIHMLVTIVLRNPEKYFKNLNFVTVADIYEEFIQGKFDCLFEKSEAIQGSNEMQLILEQFQIYQLPQYEIAALKSLLNNKIFSSLQLNCNELLKELSTKTDLVGLIVNVNEEKPIFHHKTYEEYLMASWLARNCQDQTDLVKILFQPEYRNVRLMFDMILARNSPIHIGILSRNISLLQMHQSEISTCKDSKGRNALHLACTWGRNHPLIKLINDDAVVIAGTIESNRNRFLNALNMIKEKHSLEMDHIFNKLDLNVIGESLNKMNKNAEITSVDCDKFQIMGETIEVVDEEDDDYIEMLLMLLDHHCDPLELDNLLQWSAFTYADASFSLAALNKILDYKEFDVNSLQNFSHIPTSLHYGIVFRYNNLLKGLNEFPYQEYKYKSGNSSLLKVACESNNLEGVEQLLKMKHYQAAINIESAFSGNLLSTAIIQGNMKLVDLLLRSGAKVNGQQYPPLITTIYIRNFDCFERLLKVEGIDINEKTCNGETALFISILMKHKDMTKLLLENGADVNMGNSSYTPLQFAAANSSVELVEILLQYKPNINQKSGDSGRTALHEAAQFGDRQMIKCLIENGADATIKDNSLNTPLHIALASKNRDNAEELIRSDPRVVNEYGIDNGEVKLTPMLLASIANFPDIVELLAQFGADVDDKDNYVSALYETIQNNFESTVTLLLKLGASVNLPNCNQHTPIFAAIDHPSILRILLENGADVNWTDKNDQTALHFAAFDGLLEAAEELLNHGAEINAKSKFGTPLYCSINSKKNTELVKCLLEHGASIEDGFLAKASNEDFLPCMALLLDYGANVDALDEYGFNALVYAIMNGNLTNVTFLLEKNANPNINFLNKGNILMFAILQGNIDIIEKLVNSGVNIRNINGDNTSALHVAASVGDILSLLWFLEFGLDVNCLDDKGRTPLHYLTHDDLIKSVSGLSLTLKIKRKMHLSFNNEDCALELIARGADINRMDNQGLTALHLACFREKSNLIKLLVEKGADINSVSNQNLTPLHLCYITNNIDDAAFLLANGAHPDIEDQFGKIPYIYAIENAYEIPKINVEILQKLHEQGANLEIADTDGFTFLHKAVLNGDIETVDFLIDKINIDHKTVNGKTPIFLACEGDNLEVIAKMLINRSCKINLQDNFGNSPLHYAVLKDHESIIVLLIENGAELDIKNIDGHTPLYIAIATGSYVACKILIEANARLDMITNSGFSLLHLAINNGKLDLVPLLLQHGATVDDDSLFLAVSKGNLDVLKLLLQNGVNINQTDHNGLIPLHHACINGNLELVKFLCTEGGDLFAETSEGNNLLICGVNHIPILKYLLEFGFDISLKNPKNGFTALHVACINNNYDSILFLMENGADINALDINHLTPLQHAACNGNAEAVYLLLSFNANITIPDLRNGKSVLVNAVREAPFEIFRIFVETIGSKIDNLSNNYGIESEDYLNREWQKCLLYAAFQPKSMEKLLYLHNLGLGDINEVEENLTPLFGASYVGNYESTLYLINHGANINKTDIEDGCTPLIYAVYNGHLNIAKILVEHGADINHLNNDKQSSLHYAASRGFLEIVKFLHDIGGDIHGVDQKGNTPLHEAAESGHLKIIKFLLLHQANPHLKNKKGKKPFDLAVENKQEDVVKFLRNFP